MNSFNEYCFPPLTTIPPILQKSDDTIVETPPSNPDVSLKKILTITFSSFGGLLLVCLIVRYKYHDIYDNRFFFIIENEPKMKHFLNFQLNIDKNNFYKVLLSHFFFSSSKLCFSFTFDTKISFCKSMNLIFLIFIFFINNNFTAEIDNTDF